MMKPHRGPVILTFGILGLVVCAVFGVVAWVMGNNDVREMDQGYMDPSGRDLTTVGRILGIIGTVIMILQFILVFIYFCFIALVAISAH